VRIGELDSERLMLPKITLLTGFWSGAGGFFFVERRVDEFERTNRKDDYNTRLAKERKEEEEEEE